MSEVKNCNNCEFWARNAVQYRDRQFKPCYAESMQSESYGEGPWSGVNCFDGEYGTNVFESGPLFCCVHFKEKP